MMNTTRYTFKRKIAITEWQSKTIGRAQSASPPANAAAPRSAVELFLSEDGMVLRDVNAELDEYVAMLCYVFFTLFCPVFYLLILRALVITSIDTPVCTANHITLIFFLYYMYAAFLCYPVYYIGCKWSQCLRDS